MKLGRCVRSMEKADFRDFVETVRERSDIVEVIGAHIHLDRHNKALCPFHDETNPSFSVDPKRGIFKCFGCSTYGDVFTFLQHHLKMTFWESLTMLAEQAGIPLPNMTPEKRKRIIDNRTIADIRFETAKFYHQGLTTEADNYLTEERRFTKETISRFMIGYANGGLRKHLVEECRFLLQLCLEAGVLKRDDNGKVRDYFYKRIIFPNLKHGRVVHLTGRSLNDQGPKYIHLPGEIQYLYNEDALYDKEVLITEGIPDCLSEVQAGYSAVAVLGTHQFKEEHRARFKPCTTVYVLMDGDDAGKQAAKKIGRILADKAIIVELPDKLDLNDYLKNHSQDDLRELKESGKAFLDLEVERLKACPENRRLEKIQEFLPVLADVSEFQRKHYTDVISREFKITKKTIKSYIQASRIQESQTEEGEQVEDKPSYTDQEEQEALELLKDPNLLERFNKMTEKLGCVGEENNKVMLYLAFTSRILDDPISLYIKGDSSGGKSFLVDVVSRFFPAEDVLAFTTITTKALYHRTDNLSHKVLIIYEREGAEESDYSIRSLQSEKKLTISLPVKDPETGRFETVDLEIMGPVAVIETTTKSHLHPENETRCFTLFIDDSEEQTKRIHKALITRYSGVRLPDLAELRVWQAAQKELKPHPVWIPYWKHLKFPTQPLRMRRDFLRFLTLIAVSTLLYQHQRQKATRDGVEYLIAGVEDYATAFVLGSSALGRAIKQLSPKAEELLDRVKSSVDGDLSKLLTRRDIRELVGWEHKTVVKYVKECVGQGVLEIGEGGNGKTYKYRFIKSPDETGGVLLHPRELQRLIETEELSNLSTPIQNADGQVNALNKSELDQPIQAIQRRTVPVTESPPVADEEEQLPLPLTNGQVGQVDSSDCTPNN